MLFFLSRGKNMSKRVGLVAGIALLALPSVAAAKENLEPRMQAVLECEAISANEARLQCFDQAILPLKQAMTRGSLILKENKGPSALGGVVKASGKSGANRYWVLLDNGERWSIQTAKDRRDAPKPGTVLRMKKTFFGNYWVNGAGWPESEGTFLSPAKPQ
jgi:hypothetical protein